MGGVWVWVFRKCITYVQNTSFICCHNTKSFTKCGSAVHNPKLHVLWSLHLKWALCGNCLICIPYHLFTQPSRIPFNFQIPNLLLFWSFLNINHTQWVIQYNKTFNNYINSYHNIRPIKFSRIYDEKFLK